MTPISRRRLHAVIVVKDHVSSPVSSVAETLPSTDVLTASEIRRDLARLRAEVLALDGRISGAVDLVAQIRAAHPTLPILFVAPKLESVSAASFAGANDFVLETACAKELAIRLRLLSSAAARPLRRESRIGALRLNREARTLAHGERSVNLSPIELRMFERLLFEAGQPVSRSDLERSIWGQAELADHPTNVAVVYVSYLRRKLARLGDVCWITTITNVGYTLEVRDGATKPTRARSRS
ncbi:MAG TPA: winged helix-turn-helix domain-containing protein [Gemmatimonadaceae bacterium]